MWTEILSYIDTDCPYRGSLHWYETLDSTNRKAKELAMAGAPHGSVVIAGSQSAGRGRMGRSFCSPEGNLYFSMILRPECPPEKLMHLTCWAAVAACDAVEAVTGIRPRVKWINDLVYGKKKLGGILTEMVLQQDAAPCAIIGIGINCLQVPAQVSDMATSLLEMVQKGPCIPQDPHRHDDNPSVKNRFRNADFCQLPYEGSQGCGSDSDSRNEEPLVSPARMAAALAKAMWESDYTVMPGRYREDCMTLGQPVKRMDNGQTGTALDVTEEGALVIAMDDGTVQTVFSGEVSVRGLYGYV